MPSGARRIDSEGSIIATIEALSPTSGRRLRAYETPDLSEVEKWLADNEVLDPEGPDEMFEALSNRGLLRRLRPGKRTRTPVAVYAAGAVAATAVGGLLAAVLLRRPEDRTQD